MNEVLNTILNWSEAWALLMPLIILLIFKPKGKSIRPLILYVYIGFGINLISTILYAYHYQMPSFLQNNNIFYNMHSIVRVAFFGWYILSIRPQWGLSFYKIILILFGIFLLINFTFFETPLFLSSRLFTIEGITLIVLCSFFFLKTIQDDSDTNWLGHASFWACVGIGFYEIVNLFIFLFYYELAKTDREFGLITMIIQKISLLIFCLFICLPFIQTSKKKSN